MGLQRHRPARPRRPEKQCLPKRVAGLQGVCCAAAGAYHAIAVAEDGVVHGWGDCADDALGLQLTTDQLMPLEYPSTVLMAAPAYG